ncbi:hypothetical protein PPACK8108_LOCUS9203 [Phakopsora pachyrhizi]|uniref:Uncharacterized protein n=1 Tax=Phakopsora pachyrhizi TaxID=170000 RepID=A0AAV0AW26_PHAPC|nr:hypothetical protein PPACK8108_LOCUS9203 [Phakopsora pachyrhizi]
MSRIGRLIRTVELHDEAQIRRNINLYQSISTSTTSTRQEAIDLNSASPNTPTKQLILRKEGEGEGEGKDGIYDQSRPDSCLRLALFNHQPIDNQNLSPWSILKVLIDQLKGITRVGSEGDIDQVSQLVTESGYQRFGTQEEE